MDSFELNKIIAAILMVALLIIGIGKLSDIVFYVEKPKTPGYAVEVAQVNNDTAATSGVVDEEKVEGWYESSKPTIILKGVESEMALKYVEAIRGCGAKCDLQAVGN